MNVIISLLNGIQSLVQLIQLSVQQGELSSFVLIQLILFALALLQSIVLHSLLSIHRRFFLLRVILALLLHDLIVDVQGGVDEDRGYLLPSSRVIM